MKKFFPDKLLVWFHGFGSLASIFGLVVFIFLEDSRIAAAAFLVLVGFLSLILWRVWRVLGTYLETASPTGYRGIATMVRYSTDDGNTIHYDTYKFIQCRRLVMAQYEHQYKWSGTLRPEFSSKFQRVAGNTAGEAGDWDRLCLEFPMPLRYNQMAVVHVGMKLNDADRKSGSYIETKIHEPVQLLLWRVELRHVGKRRMPPARVTRKPSGSVSNAGREEVTSVAFDRLSRSYVLELTNPDVGYFYRMEWPQ